MSVPNSNCRSLLLARVVWTLLLAGLLAAAIIFAVSRDSDSLGIGDADSETLTAEAPSNPSAGPLQSEHSGKTALRTKPEFDTAILIEALHHPNRDVGLGECGRLLREQLQRTGDFAAARAFLATLPRSDARTLVQAWVIGTTTWAGSAQDFLQTGVLMDDLGFGDDERLSMRMHHESGGLAFVDLAREKPKVFDNVPYFDEMLKGSAKHHGVRSTLNALAAFDVSPERVDWGVKWLLTNDPMEASRTIGELPTGNQKDLMITALIGWLKEHGETSSIDPWLDQLSGDTAKPLQDHPE